MLALLCYLGFWQLDRAQQKRDMQAAFAEALQAAPRPVDSTARLAELPQYEPVRLHGRYDPGRQGLLDAQTHRGRVGYRVWTPFTLVTGGTVLVDRGWIEAGPDRTALPDLAVGDELRTVTGLVSPLPRPGIRLGPGPADESWPRRLLWPDAEMVRRTWGPETVASLVLLGESEPDGFVRDWTPAAELPPERHVGYAVQWFGLALALVVIFLVLVMRREKRRDD